MRIIKWLPVVMLVNILGACSSLHQAKLSGPQYDVVSDTATKVLRGKIDRSIIEGDTAFKWFAENMKWGSADAGAIEAFKKYGDQFTLVVFGGTWCHDSQNLLPELYRLVDKSNYPDSNIQLFVVDRKKEALGNVVKKYKVSHTPTFIVLKNGKEVGRVVEYGKYGKIDKELGEIVVSAFSK